MMPSTHTNGVDGKHVKSRWEEARGMPLVRQVIRGSHRVSFFGYGGRPMAGLPGRGVGVAVAVGVPT
jgi:hypothetical protein